MAIIYTYPSATPSIDDLIVISDTSETDPKNATRSATISSILALGGGTATFYTGGDGIDVTGTVVSTDNLANGGIIYNGVTPAGKLQVDLGATNMANYLVQGDGGTGITTYSPGDIIYTNNFAGGTLAKLSGGTSGQVLTMSGGLPPLPYWVTPTTGTVTSVGFSTGTTGLTVSSDTVNPIVATGTFTIAGTLAAKNGGTGQSSYTVGDIIYASGAEAIGKLAAGTSTHVLTANGAGVAPSYQATGSMTSFTAAGTAGVNQTISNGDTFTLAAGTGITTTGVATDTITIAASYPTAITYNTLNLLGSSSGGTNPAFSLRLGQYWTAGEYVYLEFWFAISSITGLTGNIILDNLPINAKVQGAALPQGSCVIHENTGMGSGAGTYPLTGKVADAGCTVSQMAFKSHGTSGLIANSTWGNVGEAPWTLGGTIQYIKAPVA